MSKFKNIPNQSILHNGETRWLSRSLAVVVTIILNGEKALIVKRGKNMTQSGKWCNPCGYLDWNESGTQCCYRELWEETGLDIKEMIEENPDIVIFDSMIYPWDIVTNPDLNHNQDVALYYGISIKTDSEPEVHNKNCEEGEIDEVKWINIEELNNYDFAYNHDKRILKFINYIKNIS